MKCGRKVMKFAARKLEGNINISCLEILKFGKSLLPSDITMVVCGIF